MRGFIIIALLLFGAWWAFDAYEYGGRYSQAAWQQANATDQKFAREVQHWIDANLSGH
jgi:hypothetical protein